MWRSSDRLSRRVRWVCAVLTACSVTALADDAVKDKSGPKASATDNVAPQKADPSAPAVDESSKKDSPTKESTKWISLFDGKTLKGWQITKFGGEGEVLVKDGALILSFGNDLTGVHTKRKLPKVNYEVQLQAQRVDGSDFFCGFTFPVKDSFCSLIVGGWGGGVCGISSLDYMDASENETTTYQEFQKGKWYDIRVRVTDNKIEAWIDDEQIVDVKTDGRRISTRLEVELSQPFGFASWQTTAALRNIRIRPLKATDQDAPQPAASSES